MTYRLNPRPRRSVLYMPGSNMRALEKAKTLITDCVIFDLEDAVAPDAKESARNQVLAAVEAGGYGAREVVVRINALETLWGEDDLNAFLASQADAILLPKVNDASDIMTAESKLRSSPSKPIKLWAMMETPLAMLNAQEIAATAQSENSLLTCFVMGTNDLAKDTGAALTQDRFALLPWLMTCVAAARAYGLAIIDGVFNDLSDKDAFHAQCVQGAQLGMDGKTLIHPKQLETANSAFAPSAEEVIEAEKILEAFALSENQNKGAISLDGRMVERLHAEMAEKTLSVVKAIKSLEENTDKVDQI